MTQSTEQNVRTRDEQQTALIYIIEVGDMVDPFKRMEVANRHILEAEARGAEEQRRKDAGACERWEFDEPEYHDQGMGCGLEDRGIHDRYQAMEYGWDQAIERCIERIPEVLYTHPANVAALEAEIASLKMTQAHSDGIRNEKQSCINALEAVVRDYQKVIRHIVWTASEYGIGKRGHESAVDRARAALTREGGV